MICIEQYFFNEILYGDRKERTDLNFFYVKQGYLFPNYD